MQLQFIQPSFWQITIIYIGECLLPNSSIAGVNEDFDKKILESITLDGIHLEVEELACFSMRHYQIANLNLELKLQGK